MPLEEGKSEKVISHNIEEMRNAGHPEKVAVAAAMHNADKYGYKRHDGHTEAHTEHKHRRK